LKSILSTVHDSRHWLLTKPYAAIDTEFKIDDENELKPYAIYAASIVDSNGLAQFRHITDYHSQEPDKELVKWLMDQMLWYRLTIGWYSKGVKLKKEDGTVVGKDSDLKIIDSVCKYYDIPSIVDFNKIGVPYIRGYEHELCERDLTYAARNKFRKYYHIDLYEVYKKPLIKSVVCNNKYRSLRLAAVCNALIGECKLE
jgi:hypothetical protein